MNWYYVERGAQAGPVSEEQLVGMAQNGQIGPETLVWREGMTSWQPYCEVQSQFKIVAVDATAGGADRKDAPPLQPGQAVCSECSRVFPIDEMIRHGPMQICANCKPVFMQKLSEGAQLQTLELNYARVLTRFAAVFVDGLILFGVNSAIGFVIGLVAVRFMGRMQPSDMLTLRGMLFVINTLVAMSYETSMVGKWGATLGKMAFKIKVVTADGTKLSYARSLGRHFAKILSSVTCCIGYFIAAFDQPQKRALHDHICNTRVVLR